MRKQCCLGVSVHLKDCAWTALFKERDALRAEAALARERLGPAGWKMVREVAAMRAVVSAARPVMLLHTRACSYGRAGGDEGEFCSCERKERRIALSALDAARGEG